MNINKLSSALRPFLFSIPLAASFGAMACANEVVTPESESNTASAAVSTNGASGKAIAVLYSDLYGDTAAASDPNSTTSASSGGGPGIDPSTLYLKIGSEGLACSDPSASGGCGSWSLSIGLPPELQKPGIIPLSWDLLGSFSVQGPDEGDGVCWFGGGSLLGGTLEIVSINAQKVVFKLHDTEDAYGDFNADGTYVADRCSGVAEPPPPPPTNPSAIALLRSQLFPVDEGDTGGSTSSGGAELNVDSNTLLLMVGNQPPICADPHAPVLCGSFLVYIDIPPALQQPGAVIPLSTLELRSSFYVRGPDEEAWDCWMGAGHFFDGTIEIVSIDSESVVFTLQDTYSTQEINADGTYTAPRCP